MKRLASGMDHRLSRSLPMLPPIPLSPITPRAALSPRWPERRHQPRHYYIGGVRTKLIGVHSYPNPHRFPRRLIVVGGSGGSLQKVIKSSSAAELSHTGVFTSTDDLLLRHPLTPRRRKAVSCEDVSGGARSPAWDCSFSESGVSLGDSRTELGSGSAIGDADCASQCSFGSSSAFHELAGDSEQDRLDSVSGPGSVCESDRTVDGDCSRSPRTTVSHCGGDSRSRNYSVESRLGSDNEAWETSNSASATCGEYGESLSGVTNPVAENKGGIVSDCGRASPVGFKQQFYHSTPVKCGSPYLSVFPAGVDALAHTHYDDPLSNIAENPVSNSPGLFQSSLMDKDSLHLSPLAAYPQAESGHSRTVPRSTESIPHSVDTVRQCLQGQDQARRQQQPFSPTLYPSTLGCSTLEEQTAGDSVRFWLTTGHTQRRAAVTHPPALISQPCSFSYHHQHQPLGQLPMPQQQQQQRLSYSSSVPSGGAQSSASGSVRVLEQGPILQITETDRSDKQGLGKASRLQAMNCCGRNGQSGAESRSPSVESVGGEVCFSSHHQPVHGSYTPRSLNFGGSCDDGGETKVGFYALVEQNGPPLPPASPVITESFSAGEGTHARSDASEDIKTPSVIINRHEDVSANTLWCVDDDVGALTQPSSQLSRTTGANGHGVDLASRDITDVTPHHSTASAPVRDDVSNGAAFTPRDSNSGRKNSASYRAEHRDDKVPYRVSLFSGRFDETWRDERLLKKEEEKKDREQEREKEDGDEEGGQPHTDERTTGIEVTAYSPASCLDNYSCDETTSTTTTTTLTTPVANYAPSPSPSPSPLSSFLTPTPTRALHPVTSRDQQVGLAHQQGVNSYTPPSAPMSTRGGEEEVWLQHHGTTTTTTTQAETEKEGRPGQCTNADRYDEQRFLPTVREMSRRHTRHTTTITTTTTTTVEEVVTTTQRQASVFPAAQREGCITAPTTVISSVAGEGDDTTTELGDTGWRSDLIVDKTVSTSVLREEGSEREDSGCRFAQREQCNEKEDTKSVLNGSEKLVLCNERENGSSIFTPRQKHSQRSEGEDSQEVSERENTETIVTDREEANVREDTHSNILRGQQHSLVSETKDVSCNLTHSETKDVSCNLIHSETKDVSCILTHSETKDDSCNLTHSETKDVSCNLTHSETKDVSCNLTHSETKDTSSNSTQQQRPLTTGEEGKEGGTHYHHHHQHHASLALESAAPVDAGVNVHTVHLPSPSQSAARPLDQGDGYWEEESTPRTMAGSGQVNPNLNASMDLLDSLQQQLSFLSSEDVIFTSSFPWYRDHAEASLPRFNEDHEDAPPVFAPPGIHGADDGAPPVFAPPGIHGAYDGAPPVFAPPGEHGAYDAAVPRVHETYNAAPLVSALPTLHEAYDGAPPVFAPPGVYGPKDAALPRVHERNDVEDKDRYVEGRGHVSITLGGAERQQEAQVSGSSLSSSLGVRVSSTTGAVDLKTDYLPSHGSSVSEFPPERSSLSHATVSEGLSTYAEGGDEEFTCDEEEVGVWEERDRHPPHLPPPPSRYALWRAPVSSSSELDDSDGVYTSVSTTDSGGPRGDDTESDLPSSSDYGAEDYDNVDYTFNDFVSGLQDQYTSDRPSQHHRKDTVTADFRSSRLRSCIQETILEADDESETADEADNTLSVSIDSFRSSFHFSLPQSSPRFQAVCPAPEVRLWSTDQQVTGLSASEQDRAHAVCPSSPVNPLQDLSDRLSSFGDVSFELHTLSFPHDDLDLSSSRHTACSSPDPSEVSGEGSVYSSSATAEVRKRTELVDTPPRRTQRSPGHTPSGRRLHSTPKSSKTSKWVQEKILSFQKLLNDFESECQPVEQTLMEEMCSLEGGRGGAGSSSEESLVGNQSGVYSDLYRSFTRDYLEKRQSHVCPFVENGHLPVLRFKRFLRKKHNSKLKGRRTFRVRHVLDSVSESPRLAENGGDFVRETYLLGLERSYGSTFSGVKDAQYQFQHTPKLQSPAKPRDRHLPHHFAENGAGSVSEVDLPGGIKPGDFDFGLSEVRDAQYHFQETPRVQSPCKPRDRLLPDMFADDTDVKRSLSDSAYSTLSDATSRHVSDLDSSLRSVCSSHGDVTSIVTDLSMDSDKLTSLGDVFDQLDVCEGEIDQALLDRLRVGHYKADTL